MQSTYRKIFDVQLMHDYYLLQEEESAPFWPDNYSILQDLDFIPTPDCQQTLNRQNILFKKTSYGFQLYAKAIPSIAEPGQFQTFIPLSEEIKFDFFIVVKNPYFINFTNLRLTGKDRYLYYFNNISGATTTPKLHLSKPHLSTDNLVNTLPNETAYQLGDIINQGINHYELSQNIMPDDTINENNKIELANQNNRYVTARDRYKWQSSNFIYADSDNSTPGEEITFSLKNIRGNEVDLGYTPSTNELQSEIMTPPNGASIYHTIDLSNIPQGIHTMNIERGGNREQKTFFLLNPIIQPDAFGVIEIFKGSPKFQFIDFSNPNESIINEKTYHIHFKNRTTSWQYFDENESELTEPNTRPKRALQKQFSKFQLGDLIVPDPDISTIYPERTANSEDLIETIFSKVYLNQ